MLLTFQTSSRSRALSRYCGRFRALGGCGSVGSESLSKSEGSTSGCCFAATGRLGTVCDLLPSGRRTAVIGGRLRSDRARPAWFPGARIGRVRGWQPLGLGMRFCRRERTTWSDRGSDRRATTTGRSQAVSAWAIQTAASSAQRCRGWCCYSGNSPFFMDEDAVFGESADGSTSGGVGPGSGGGSLNLSGDSGTSSDLPARDLVDSGDDSGEWYLVSRTPWATVSGSASARSQFRSLIRREARTGRRRQSVGTVVDKWTGLVGRLLNRNRSRHRHKAAAGLEVIPTSDDRTAESSR